MIIQIAILELSELNYDIHNICSTNSHYSIKDSRITEIAIDPAAIKECESIMSHKTMYYEDPFAAISWVDGVIKAQKVWKHNQYNCHQKILEITIL